jgi:hypothetical protein
MWIAPRVKRLIAVFGLCLGALIGIKATDSNAANSYSTGRLEVPKAATMPTCNSGTVNRIVAANGEYGEGPTKLCVCRGYGGGADTSAPPGGYPRDAGAAYDTGFYVYQWCSLTVAGSEAVVCLGGTPTVCP